LTVVERSKRARQETDTAEEKTPATTGSVVYRRVAPARPSTEDAQATARQKFPKRTFRVSGTTGAIVLIENKLEDKNKTGLKPVAEDADKGEQMDVDPVHSTRKRPGARTALLRPPIPADYRSATPEPSQDTLREFEQFANEVEKEDGAAHPETETKYKPRAPKLRFKDRHPALAAKLAAENQAVEESKIVETVEAMDEDYVYDHFIREIVMEDSVAVTNAAVDHDAVGFIVLSEEDEAFWFDTDESDREFDTDEDDENAEGYYANDYPEDELSSDDEYDRDAYQYYRDVEEEDEYEVDDGNGSDVSNLDQRFEKLLRLGTGPAATS
jgi:hypothetical protein